MRIRILVFALTSAASLCAQHRFSWQEACFKNPAAPFCPGNDFAIKPQKPEKNAKPRGPVTDPSAIIDWRFADPSADALVGFDAGALSNSPLALSLIAQLGTNQGVTAEDMQKIFDGLSAVNQVALSFRDNQVVVYLTGPVTASTLPPLQAGWKAAPVRNAMLVGHADAVDQAVQRMATENAPGELARLAATRQADSDFWAVGSGALLGPQAASAGMKRFSLAISISDRFTSDLVFEFNAAPDPKALRLWPATLGDTSIEASVIHFKISMESDKAQQKFAQIAGSPLGQRVAALVRSARYLPVRESR